MDRGSPCTASPQLIPHRCSTRGEWTLPLDVQGKPDRPAIHWGFKAESNETVDEFYKAAISAAAHFDENSPTFTASSAFKGALTQRPDQFGRVVLSVAFTSDGPPASLAAYATDGFHLNLISIDKVAEDTPSLSGLATR